MQAFEAKSPEACDINAGYLPKLSLPQRVGVLHGRLIITLRKKTSWQRAGYVEMDQSPLLAACTGECGNHPLRTAGDDVLRMRPEIGSGGAVYTREAPIPRQELCEISD
ncbi:MAG: hypothetical protein AB7S92_13130, partial [Parvibaculaceae bacterium]